MKAVAFANNDIAVVAWSFGGKLPDCLGFAVYRIDVRAGTETCLPAMATFPKQDAAPGRTTADDPVQKFFWKDVSARRGGTYKYKIVPMAGTPGALHPMPYGPVVSNQVQLTPALRHPVGLFQPRDPRHPGNRPQTRTRRRQPGRQAGTAHHHTRRRIADGPRRPDDRGADHPSRTKPPKAAAKSTARSTSSRTRS